MKSKYFIFITVIILLAAGSFLFKRRSINDGPNIMTPTEVSVASATPTPTPSPSPSPSNTGRVLIAVPFTSQAPHGIWDEFHEHTCEEATLVMANAWVKGLNLTPDYVEGELQKLAQWGRDYLGTYIDSNARDTARMGEAVYGLKTRIIDQPSVQDIKDEIDVGNIVIMGMAGRMLGNPNYTPPGPLYHMLLIKGYDATGFITNDDGTRKGNSYHYSFDTLMAAAHDWNGDAAGLTSNPAVAFVVSKN